VPYHEFFLVESPIRQHNDVQQQWEITMTNYGVAGNLIEEQDILLLVASRERGSEPHQDSPQSAAVTAIWYATDHSGSVREVFSTSELVVDTVTYDSFGNLLNEANATDNDAFQRYDCDPNVLLYQSCTRAYDPTIARWLTDEPIGFGAGADDLDSYVASDVNEANE
jgi:RHS repeat-associated protein